MDEKITLEFDNGEVVEYDILGIFSVKGVDYIALLDAEEDQEYLYKYIEDGEYFELDEVPEEDFDEVAAEYEKLMSAVALMTELSCGKKSGEEDGWLLHEEVSEHLAKKRNEE